MVFRIVYRIIRQFLYDIFCRSQFDGWFVISALMSVRSHDVLSAEETDGVFDEAPGIFLNESPDRLMSLDRSSSSAGKDSAE
jgi:hypothetical protein